MSDITIKISAGRAFPNCRAEVLLRVASEIEKSIGTPGEGFKFFLHTVVSGAMASGCSEEKFLATMLYVWRAAAAARASTAVAHLCRANPFPTGARTRPSRSRHQGHAFTVTVGYDLAGRPREIFADTSKAGTELAHMIANACIVINLALQRGAARRRRIS